MNWSYLIISWLHLIAAIFWVGGMLFLSLVVVPTMKGRTDPAQAQRWFLQVARRFRRLVWLAIVVLIFTGAFLLSLQIDLSAPPSKWPLAVIVKLLLVLLLLTTSVAHDRIGGPKVRTIKQKVILERSVAEGLIVQLSPWVGRLTTILGLAVVFAGVVMVRS